MADNHNKIQSGHNNYMLDPENVFHRLMMHEGCLNNPCITTGTYMTRGEKGAIIMTLNTQVNLLAKMPLAISIIDIATNNTRISLLFKYERIEVYEGNSTIYVSCGKMFENILNVACFLLDK